MERALLKAFAVWLCTVLAGFGDASWLTWSEGATGELLLLRFLRRLPDLPGALGTAHLFWCACAISVYDSQRPRLKLAWVTSYHKG